MKVVTNHLVGVQAVFAGACFCLGAILTAVGRGVESGAGGVGFQAGNFPCVYNSTYVRSIPPPGVYPPPAPTPPGTIPPKPPPTLDPGVMDCRFNGEKFTDTGLKKVWQQRNDANGLLVMGNLLAVLGWFFSIPPVAALAALFDQASSGRVSTSSTMVYSFVFAAALALIQVVSEIGTMQTTEWITSSWGVFKPQPGGIPPGGISVAQALEITYLLVQSRSLWLFAMNDLFLIVALGTAFLLGRKSTKVPPILGYIGLAVCFFCFLDWCFEVTRFVNWRGSTNGVIVMSIIIKCFLLPAWLVKLGTILRTDLTGDLKKASVELASETIKTTKMVAEESVKAAKEGSVTAVAVAGAVAGAGVAVAGAGVGLVLAAPGMPKEVKVAPPAGGEPEQWEAL